MMSVLVPHLSYLVLTRFRLSVMAMSQPAGIEGVRFRRRRERQLPMAFEGPSSSSVLLPSNILQSLVQPKTIVKCPSDVSRRSSIAFWR